MWDLEKASGVQAPISTRCSTFSRNAIGWSVKNVVSWKALVGEVRKSGDGENFNGEKGQMLDLPSSTSSRVGILWGRNGYG